MKHFATVEKALDEAFLRQIGRLFDVLFAEECSDEALQHFKNGLSKAILIYDKASGEIDEL